MKQYAIEIAYRGNVTAKNKDAAIKDFVTKVADGRVKSVAKYVIIPIDDWTKIHQRIILWLVDGGYSIEEAEEQIKNATITSKLGVYTIIYNNGVMDRIRLTKDKVEHLNKR